MKLKEAMNKYNISDATLRNWKKLKYIKDINDIKEEEIENILKNKVGIRRNKRNSNNNIIPISYIEDKKIVDIITTILEIKKKYNANTKEILHETIIKLLKQKNLAPPEEIENILGTRINNLEFLNEFDSIIINYEEDNDFLGCLYMSLISVGKKDINGIYYTPFKVVDKIIKSIDFNENKLIVDPSCGSGNFLIQAFKNMKCNQNNLSNIIDRLYGYDIDELAVLLAKVNIYILDNNIDWNKINIYQKDFLTQNIDTKFDIIIGNPPWGKKYKEEEKKELKKKYGQVFSKMDSFAQFILKSFDAMKKGGVLGFVLPSSILNIATHQDIRKFILKNKINYIKNIGREFEEIVTDIIIMKIEKASGEDNIVIYNEFKVNQSDFEQNPYCNFLTIDNYSKSIINKIKNYNSYHLKEDVNYALGIVTGDNQKFLLDTKTDNNEMIISGKNIDRYNINYDKVQKYIVYAKEQFQQVAKEEFYRHKNKIIYKFIGKKLCFAAEKKGTLTLNSANIICLSDKHDLFYITAILNSRITQLYFEDTYNSHKVLKNHIQSFYIPVFDKNTMKTISDICENIKGQSNYCEEIEEIIYTNLKLTKEEIKYLKNRF